MKLSLTLIAIFAISAQTSTVAADSQRQQTASSHTPISSLMKPSFNCVKGHSFSERLICSDPELGKIDYELSLVYAQAKLATHNSAAFKKANNEEWLWRERNCHDRNCVLQWYAHRRVQLNDVLTATKKPASVTSNSSVSTPQESDTALHPDNNQALITLPENLEASATSAVSNQLQPATAVSQQLTSVSLPRNPIFWLVIAGIVIAAFFAWDTLLADKQTRKRARMIATAVRINIEELAAQQSQLVAGESSHMHDPKKWDKEKRRFIEDNVKTALTDGTPLSATEADKLSLLLDYLVHDAQHGRSRYKFRGNLDAISSRDYLYFCARVLKDHDWKVRVVNANKANAYLIATKKGLVIVALCKPQSIPVGLDALREVQALQVKLVARKAVIISNAPFATSAQREAEKSAALLLHHFDLSLLTRMVEL